MRGKLEKLRKMGFSTMFLSAMVSIVLVATAAVPPAFAADAGLGAATTVDYTEGASAITALPDITVTGGPFDGEYIEFEVDPSGSNSDNKEDLAFPEVATLAEIDQSTGSVTIHDGRIYLGEGGSYSQIGQISSTFDGQDGTKLRAEFVSSFDNASFESVASGTSLLTTPISGWTARAGQVNLGSTVITIDGQSFTIPEQSTYPDYGKGCSPSDDNATASALTTYVNVVTGETGGKNNYSDGSNGLELRSTGTSVGRGDTVHGPMVWSDEFSGESGQVLSFDWLAAAGGDNYHIWAALLRTDSTQWIEVLDATGNSSTAATNWATESVTIPADGTYRFVFVSGTQDYTCGQGIGARLVIDKVQVVGNKALVGVVQTLARTLTYFNDGDGPDSTQTLRVTAKPTAGAVAIQDHTIRLIGVNDAPSIDGDGSTAAVALTVVETDVSSTDSPIPNATGTLSGYDPDMDSPTYSFGILGETGSGGTVSKSGNYGTLTLNVTSGAFTYVPDMAAIKPLDTGDDPVDSFSLTVSDGALTGSGSLNVTIDSFTDTEPSAPTITAVIPGNQHLSVLFDAPSSEGGSSITDYEWSTDGVNFEAIGSVPLGSFTINVLSSDGTSSLVNGTAYPISIRATNGQISPVSNSISGTPVSGPAINTPTIQSFEPSASLTAVDEDFKISGFGFSDDILVSIGLDGQASGTQFALANFEDSGASEGSGYSPYTDGTAVTEFAMTGTQTEVNAAIRGLKIKTGSSRTNFTINVSASVVSGSVVQSGTTQSFYEYVSASGVTWDDAKAAAALKTFAGVRGYLVTITSSAENAFVKARINGATNIWIGATDSTEEGVWRWMTGPEGQNGGTVFWTVDDGEITFDSWSSGEPNDFGSGEDAAVTNWGSATGTWNDLPLSYGSVGGYVVEYSEWNGQTFSTSEVVKANSEVSMGGPVLSVTSGSASAALSWTVPTRSGQTITAYAVTSTPSVPGVSACSGATASCTVSGLENGTEYSFTVTATWSDSVTSTSNSISVRPVASAPTSPTRTNTPAASDPPVVIPTVPSRVTTPPRNSVPVTQSGPVLTRGVVSAPPKAPTLMLDGRPTLMSVTVPTTTQLDVKTGRLSLRVKVLEGQGTISEALDGTTQIAVKKGASATIKGSGFMPLATVQVFLPLEGDNAKELTRIPVGANGSFDGSAPFATRPNEAPLPVGKQVLQLVSLDNDGNQVVVEMTVSIAQGAPAPEANRFDGAIPTMQPGQSIATSGGNPVPVTITPVSDQKLAVVEGDGWSMAVNVNSAQGGVEPVGGGALLKLVRNETAMVSGSGFMPGTRADVWMFSDPTLLGTVTIDENGEFVGEVNIDPNMIPVGEHTLQLQGVGEDGYVKAANMGVVVDDPVDSAANTAAASLTFLWWVIAAVMVFLVLAVILVNLRRRQA